ncbi:MAG: YybH family protein [Gemmatimonadota bacterium]
MKVFLVAATSALLVGACQFSSVPADGTTADSVSPGASTSPSTPTSTTATVDAEAAIRGAAAAFSAAFEAGDTTALGELYTTDALLLAPNDTVRGRAAIRRWFAPREGRNPFDHTLTADALEVRGDVAIDRGWWTQEFRREDGTTNGSSGVYLVIWRRGSDGRWRMSYDMWHAPYDRS